MSKSQTRIYKLDRNAIFKRCKELNTTVSDESRKLGFASGYIGQCIGRGCNKMQLMTLCSILECEQEDILFKEKAEEVSNSEIPEETKTDVSSYIVSELSKINSTLSDIANSLSVMTELYERAWIDKE